MLRKLMLVAMFALAAPIIHGEAHAATKEELKLEKAEVKYAKQVAKGVAKLAKKWNKNQEKGKDNTEVERELRKYYRNELAWLREKGIKTNPEPEKFHPAHPPKVLPEPEAERPRMEELRDILVELRGGDLRPKRYSNLLEQYSTRLQSRYERKNRQYKENKKNS